jgi:hypothetical protein
MAGFDDFSDSGGLFFDWDRVIVDRDAEERGKEAIGRFIRSSTSKRRTWNGRGCRDLRDGREG